jgi:biotin operon repressor
MPKRAIYDPASMEAAIQELKSNRELSLRAVAKKYGIPRTILQFKLKKLRTQGIFWSITSSFA